MSSTECQFQCQCFNCKKKERKKASTSIAEMIVKKNAIESQRNILAEFIEALLQLVRDPPPSVNVIIILDSSYMAQVFP